MSFSKKRKSSKSCTSLCGRFELVRLRAAVRWEWWTGDWLGCEAEFMTGDAMRKLEQNDGEEQAEVVVVAAPPPSPPPPPSSSLSSSHCMNCDWGPRARRAASEVIL